MRAWCVIAVLLAGTQARADDSDKTQDIAPDEPAAPASPQPTTPPTTPQPTPAPARTEPVHTMDEVTIPPSYLRFGINFFGDTSFTVVTPNAPHAAFSINPLGVRLLGQLSPSLDALAEFAFENTDKESLADVEQLLIRWRTSILQLEAGRLHTDIGFWNRAYHHGRWLQTPVERPRAVRFEDDGGIIPVHWVGLHLTLHASDQLYVVAGVGNGRGNIVDDVLVGRETNEAKSALVKVRMKTGDVEAGFGAIYDLIAPASAMIRPALPDERIHELIGNAYAAIRGEGPIVIGESYVVRHQTGSQSWMTYAAYGLVGYAVTDRVTPYAAIDMIKGGDDDPFFRPDPTMSPPLDAIEGLVGTRIDTSVWSALKLELRLDHPFASGSDDAYTAVINWSFGL